MSDQRDIMPRALPGAVFVPEHTLKMIVQKIARISDEDRNKEIVVLVKSGWYRASTDQVVLYQHESRMPPPKADLMEVVVCKVKEVSAEQRITICASKDDRKFVEFVREFWDKSLDLDSLITLLVCRNLRGKLVDYFVDLIRFNDTLPRSSQE